MLKGQFLGAALLFTSLLGAPAYAIDFVVDEKPNAQIARAYVVKQGDTLGGYALYQGEGDWLFSTVVLGSATGGDRPLLMPTMVMERRDTSKWMMGQIVTVALHRNNTGGWGGDPCGGEKLIKINQTRRMLDRCATAELGSAKLPNKQADVLRLAFNETNTGGRYYSTEIVVDYSVWGLTTAEVRAKDSEFHKKLTVWMEQMLKAVIKAAEANQPADAYAGLPTLSSVLDEFRPKVSAPVRAVESAPPKKTR